MHRTTSLTAVTVGIACLLLPALTGAASAAPGSSPVATQAAQATYSSTLKPGQQLTEGQSLQSPNGRYRLTLKNGALSVEKTPNRLNPSLYGEAPVFGEGGTRLAMQQDGNLVFYAGNRPLESTLTNGRTAAGLVMQDDGNVVLYGAEGKVLHNFATFAVNVLRAGGTLLPGESLPLEDGDTVLGMQTDGNLVLRTKGKVVYATGTQGNPGAAAVQQQDGNFVVYAANGAPLFDTGSSNDLGDLTVAVVGPSDLRVVQSAGEAVQSLFGTSWTSATVLTGQVLEPGDRRVAPNAVQLILQTDGNLVEYVGGRAVFVRNNVFNAEMRTDGDFVAKRYTGSGLSTVFTARSAGNPGSRFVVQADGNLVVYTPQGKAVYSRR